MSAESLVSQLKTGLDAPICLTWELTYACNLQCVHCLSSVGPARPARADHRRGQARCSTSCATCRSSTSTSVAASRWCAATSSSSSSTRSASDIGVKFSTNGAFIDAEQGPPPGGDGLPRHPDQPRRHRRRHQRRRARRRQLRHGPPGDGPPGDAADFGPFKISVVVTRHNVDQLDGFKALADSYGAQLRVTRLRPSGRGADTLARPAPHQRPAARRSTTGCWPTARTVLTGDSFFHLNALGESLPGLNMCGAGRVVCLIDPIGDVYACPFVIHDEFKAGSVRDDGGFAEVWKQSDLFLELREPQSAGACASCGSYDACQGGCMAAKFFTGLPLDGPDPECVGGDADEALAAAPTVRSAPRPAMDHTKPGHARHAAADPGRRQLTGPTVRASVGRTGCSIPLAYLLGTFPSAVMVARSKGIDIPRSARATPAPRTSPASMGTKWGVARVRARRTEGCDPRGRRPAARPSPGRVRDGGRSRARPHVPGHTPLQGRQGRGHHGRRVRRAAPARLRDPHGRVVVVRKVTGKASLGSIVIAIGLPIGVALGRPPGWEVIATAGARRARAAAPPRQHQAVAARSRAVGIARQ